MSEKLSMGCKVGDSERSPGPYLTEVGITTMVQDAKFLYSTLVPVPRCGGCRQTLAPASDVDWQCSNPDCPKAGQAVHTGIYPLKTLA